jgi:hypothetical protein
VRPHFRAYCDQYDTGKYWPQTYDAVLEAFQQPRTVSADTLRQAILWKYGHLRKRRIPASHEALIAALQARWPVLSRDLPATPDVAFAMLHEAFGGATRYVTVAFLTHLLYPTDRSHYRSAQLPVHERSDPCGPSQLADQAAAVSLSGHSSGRPIHENGCCGVEAVVTH